MKRVLISAALLCGILAFSSCSLIKDVASLPVRAVQGVARTAGF
jgi:hypothetical protein